jgi:tripartite-type tricarboxylate transporter receptor subunit TctC
LRDFAPITALVSATQALVANPSLPVTSVLIKVISNPVCAAVSRAAQGLVPITGTPEEFAAFIRAETKNWGKIVRDANIKPIK